jgi:hydrogenase maturation protein HypF
VHDLHPDYLGTKWALGALPSACATRVAGLPRIGVQHHHAHFAACLAENGCEDGAVGIILDGTGYGTDGTIWGGEFFVGTIGDARRVGRFAPLPMPGGAQAVRQPWRMACAALAMLDPEAGPELLPAFRARRAVGEIAAVRYLLATGENTPHTSSAGRYFDAVASLLGVADINGFEAQAAMLLEQVSRNCTDPGAAEPFPWAIGYEDGECFSLSFEPAIREIISFVHNGTDPGLPGARFHATVAAGCADAAVRVLRRHGLTRVALSGGVFQNRLLFEDLVSRLTSAGCDVLTHRLVPANDGGIALGQAAVARAQMV